MQKFGYLQVEDIEIVGSDTNMFYNNSKIDFYLTKYYWPVSVLQIIPFVN